MDLAPMDLTLSRKENIRFIGPICRRDRRGAMHASVPWCRLLRNLSFVGHAGQRTGLVMDHPPAAFRAGEKVAGDQMLVGEALIATDQPDIAEDRRFRRDAAHRN